jgi:hypothetical protein
VINQVKGFCCSETMNYIWGTVADTLTKVHSFYHTFPASIHGPLMKHKGAGCTTVCLNKVNFQIHFDFLILWAIHLP